MQRKYSKKRRMKMTKFTAFAAVVALLALVGCSGQRVTGPSASASAVSGAASGEKVFRASTHDPCPIDADVCPCAATENTTLTVGPWSTCARLCGPYNFQRRTITAVTTYTNACTGELEPFSTGAEYIESRLCRL